MYVVLYVVQYDVQYDVLYVVLYDRINAPSYMYDVHVRRTCTTYMYDRINTLEITIDEIATST